MPYQIDRSRHSAEASELRAQCEADLGSSDESKHNAALSYLYECDRGYALAIARRLGASSDAAQDILQESFLNMCRYYRNCRRTPFKMYLAATVRHVWSRRARRDQRMPYVVADLDLIECRQQEVLDRMIEDQTAEALFAALLALDDHARAVIQGCFLEGKSFREVARELGVATNTVIRKVKVTLRQLRERLDASQSKGAHK